MAPAIVLSLLAAAVYGAADFLGGIATRRTSAAVVVVLSQLAGGLVLAAAWPFAPPRVIYSDDVLLGVAAGFAGSVAVVALYAALSIGKMGIVSPITAVIAASIPILASFGFGERPTLLQLFGVACAFIAVGLVSANGDTRAITIAEPGVRLAVGSGVALGVLFVFIGHAHADGGFVRLAVTRTVSIAVLFGYLLLRREWRRVSRAQVPTIVAAGALDMAANILYVLATRFGLLSIVAVLTSLYPAATVFLARIFLEERLRRVQWYGVGVAVCGVVCIAANSR